MPAQPRAAILTLGCKLNLADSGEIARGLRLAGFDVTDSFAEADAVVVNTCSVTHVADQKSRRLVRSVRRVAPGAVVTVTGCFPQTAGFDAARALGADYVAGVADADRASLVDYIAASMAERSRDLPAPDADSRGPLTTRHFIKAQEGCNDVCAFCIVPRTRHREVSRTPERVIEAVNQASAEGAHEVVITGTQLGAWGRDMSPRLLPSDLISALLEATDVPRIRFSSLQPQDITPELLALWADPRLMPHFHLALQSGSDRTLVAMRRRYSAREYRDAVARIRAAVAGVAITTDVIAGFPGETDEDFVETLRLCDELSLSRIHAFPYSPRSQTAAMRMPGQLPPAVKKERMVALGALSTELQRRHIDAHRGKGRPVLWEHQVVTPTGLHWRGYTDNYIPLYAASEEALHNRITHAVVHGPFEDGALTEFTGALGT